MLLPQDILYCIGDYGGIDLRRCLGLPPRRLASSSSRRLAARPAIVRILDTYSVTLYFSDVKALTLVYDAAKDCRQVWVPWSHDIWKIVFFDPFYDPRFITQRPLVPPLYLPELLRRRPRVWCS